jgi:hemerythrin-like metal-binding protein
MSTTPLNIPEWSPEDAVGVPEIDREHEMAFDTLHRLHAAMLVGKGREFVRAVFPETVQVALDHFAHEEELMAAVQYPELRAHAAQHDEARRNVGAFAERFASGEITMTIELTLFVAEWLKQHFRIYDRRLAEYLKAHGSAPARQPDPPSDKLSFFSPP